MIPGDSNAVNDASRSTATNAREVSPSRSSEPTTVAPNILLRGVIPAALLALAAVHMVVGEQSLPIWLWKLAIRFNIDGVTAVRLLAAFEAALAIVIALSPRLARPMSVMAATLLAFSAIAECSALVSVGARVPDYVTPVVTLAVALALGLAISRIAPRAGHPAPRLAPGTVLGPLAALTLTLGAAARLPVADRPRAIPESWAKASDEVLFRHLDRLVGRTLPEAGLSRYQPKLTALTLEGRHVIVFYNPHCGDCQELFDLAFSSASHPEVIAVEVPPPARIIAAEGDPPKQPACPDCTWLTLQAGPAYFVKLPVVMSIENGRILCAEQKAPERCLDR